MLELKKKLCSFLIARNVLHFVFLNFSIDEKDLVAICHHFKTQAMKLFLSALEHSSMIGIRPRRPNEAYIFNRRIVCDMLIYIGLFNCTSSSFYYYDNTFKEYAQTFYVWIGMTLTGIALLITVLMLDNLFQFLEHIKKVVAKCEYKKEMLKNKISNNLLGETYLSIDKWTRIFHTAIVKISIPLGCVPIVGLSYYNYFINDLGKDSFIFTKFMK